MDLALFAPSYQCVYFANPTQAQHGFLCFSAQKVVPCLAIAELFTFVTLKGMDTAHNWAVAKRTCTNDWGWTGDLLLLTVNTSVSG